MIQKQKAEGKSPYTKVGNRIFNDKSLSLKAIGIYCLLWSLPDSWRFSVSGLSTLVRDNPASVKTGIKELEKAGYLKVVQSRKGGKYSNNDCLIFESPLCDFPSAVKPLTEKPSAENRQQEIKYKEKRYKEIKEKEIDEEIIL